MLDGYRDVFITLVCTRNTIAGDLVNVLHLLSNQIRITPQSQNTSVTLPCVPAKMLTTRRSSSASRPGRCFVSFMCAGSTVASLHQFWGIRPSQKKLSVVYMHAWSIVDSWIQFRLGCHTTWRLSNSHTGSLLSRDSDEASALDRRTPGTPTLPTYYLARTNSTDLVQTTVSSLLRPLESTRYHPLNCKNNGRTSSHAELNRLNKRATGPHTHLAFPPPPAL
jgi:hypothetical protein